MDEKKRNESKAPQAVLMRVSCPTRRWTRFRAADGGTIPMSFFDQKFDEDGNRIG